jgi:hypothetical protein
MRDYPNGVPTGLYCGFMNILITQIASQRDYIVGLRTSSFNYPNGIPKGLYCGIMNILITQIASQRDYIVGL